MSASYYSNPFRIIQSPLPKPVYTYLYLPDENRYEVVNYNNNPKRYKKVEELKPVPFKIEAKSDNFESFSNDGGQKYENSYHKKFGHKTNEGYSKDEKYHKGNKDSYGKQRKDHEENEDHDQQEGHKKGEKYNARKQHKKGSNSKGYHNVFMKDEYKKDHIFYGERSIPFHSFYELQHILTLYRQL